MASSHAALADLKLNHHTAYFWNWTLPRIASKADWKRG